MTIDLGGTNLRVCWITLRGNDSEPEVVQDRFKLPEKIKTGCAKELWDLISDSLQEFIKKHDLRGTEGGRYVSRTLQMTLHAPP